MLKQTVIVVNPEGKRTIKKLSLDASLAEIWGALGSMLNEDIVFRAHDEICVLKEEEKQCLLRDVVVEEKEGKYEIKLLRVIERNQLTLKIVTSEGNFISEVKVKPSLNLSELRMILTKTDVHSFLSDGGEID